MSSTVTHHNPYFTPTQLGGSMRRPLVERVEACRPKDDMGMSLTWFEKRGLWCWTTASSRDVYDPDDGEGYVQALALCRVAVEDWMLASRPMRSCLLRSRYVRDGEVFFSADCGPFPPFDPRERELFEEFPDIDSAINHDAHCLADALGVAP